MVSNTPVSSIRFFSGHWLTVARIVWVVLCAISVVFLFISLSSLYTAWMGQGQHCRVPMPDYSMQGELSNDCEANRQVFQRLGLPKWFPAVFFVTGAGLQVISWILVGILIFLRRYHKPWEYFFSLMFVVTGTFNLDDNLLFAGLFTVPTLTPLFRIIGPFGTILIIVIYYFPDGQIAHKSLRWFASFWVVYNFLTVFLRETPWNSNTWPDLLLIGIDTGFALSIIFALIYRYRNISGPIQRQQIKWTVLSGISFAFVFIAGFSLIYIFPSAPTSEPGLSQALVWLIYLPIYYLARIFLAGGLLFSIMRYRLWDIDFIINRSLVYGSLTVLLLVVFSGSLLAIHSLFQNFTQAPLVAVAVSAAAFGAFFQPTRRRLQRFVDQNFYNINIDYQKTLPFIATSKTQILKDTQLGDYKYLELIGRGGMGEVYKTLSVNRIGH